MGVTPVSESVKVMQMSSPATVRIALIEDQRDVREGLAFLINGSSGFRCVGAFRSVEAALPELFASPPDLVLTDLGLPGLSGIEAIRRLRASQPQLPVIALTVYDDDDHIFEAMCAGAAGYLLKTTPHDRLIDGLRDVVAGGATISPEIARRLMTAFTRVRPPASSDYDLTPHEIRLLKLFAEGHSYKAAAAELSSAVNTVSFHVRNIYRKLQVHSSSEAVAKAIRAGLI
jgi:DNA-binding NarL/FixJ family response regulator